MDGTGPNGHAGKPPPAPSGPIMRVGDVLTSLDELRAFVGKRRLVSPIIPAGKDYGDGYADGIGFTIEAIIALRNQLASRAAAAMAEHQRQKPADES